MEFCVKMKYLVSVPHTRRHLGIYEASSNAEAISMALEDPAARPVLLVLAREELQRRIQDQRHHARHRDRYLADMEIRRLKLIAQTAPLSLLAGVLAALDIPGLVRMYRQAIVHEVENRMFRLIETERDEEAGVERFESYDLTICGYFFHARCVRYDGQRMADADLEIDLIMPPGDGGQKTPDGLEIGRAKQGNGKVPRIA